MPQVWLNGSFVDESAAAVSVRDAGLLHGAGVFTTMRSRGGNIFRLADHLRRLRDSCDALFIPLPYKNEVLAHAAAELPARQNLTDARLRLTVTRGIVSQDPLHGMKVEPNVFLSATTFEPYPAEHYRRGMTVMLLDEQKLNPYDVQAGHKTLDYFSRQAALREAGRRGAGEALWFNIHNYLQSGSVSNVFLVENGRLLTPPTQADLREPGAARRIPYSRSNVLPGVTRAAIIELARAEGIEVEASALDVGRVLEAREVFLTNSIMGVMPVCRAERKVIGDDRPGEITRRLADALTKRIDSMS